MASRKAFATLGLALIFCVLLAACGGSSKAVANGAPVIAQLTLPNGAINAPYSSGVNVSQGTGNPPFTFSIASGALPAGLSLNGTTGAITGTPTAIGTSSFTVQATDAKQLTGTRMLSIDIRGAVTVTQPTLPGGQVTIPYSANVSATGGVLPYTWSVSTGSLPAGLTLTTNADSTATISGTPTLLGNSTFTLQAADAEVPPATGTSGQLTIPIEGFVTITNTSLPDGNIAIFYDVQLLATGGQAPYTWSLTSGTLPPGLSLTPGTGVISGTPTTTGSYPITVEVTDSELTPATATGSFTITINPTPPLQVTTSSLTVGTQGVRYSDSLAATGGVPPYSWSLTSGPLPAGLTLSGTGVISGTPNGLSGSFPITVQVTDTLGNHASSSGLTLPISAGPLVVTTAALPTGTQSVPYSATLAAAGGTPPYTWSVRFGTLPNGLSINTSTGVISGTPIGTGDASLQFQVKDSASPPATVNSAPLAINVNPALTDAALTGDYAFSFSGYNNGTPVFAGGRFTADGSGNISNGLLDMNTAGSPAATSVAFTGTYSITADGVGAMTFNPMSGSALVLAVAVDTTGAGRLIQSDPANPHAYGSGAIKPQTLGSLSVGRFAFGSTGVDMASNRFASAGSFLMSNSGNLAAGTIDVNDGGTVTSDTFLTGSYSAPDPGTGRGTASLSVNGATAQNFSYYLVSPQEMIQVSTDQVSQTSPATLTSVLQGSAAGSTLSNLALKGASVLQANGVNPNGGSPEAVGVAGLFNGDGTTDGNGFGNASVLFDQNTAGTLAQQQVAGGQYKVVSQNGRVTLNGFGGTPPVLYLVGQNQAFVVGTDANVSSGVLAQQAAGLSGVPLNNLQVLNGYVGGSVTPALPAVTNQVDWLLADGNGNASVSQDTSGPGGPGSSQFVVTYQVDATGRAIVDLNPGGTLKGILFVISQSKMVILSTDASAVLSTFSTSKAH